MSALCTHNLLPPGSSRLKPPTCKGRPPFSAIIDFETRSECSLKTHGAWRYAKHPSTEVLCMAYQIRPSAPVGLWRRGDPFPPELRLHINKGGLIEAHNYFFEKCIWTHIMEARFSWPGIPFESWRCSAALASRHNLPRGLEGACEALNLPVKKDKKGHALMLTMSKPRKPTKNNSAKWVENEEDLARLYAYCKQDILAERALSEALPPLEPRELATWRFTEDLNWRGVYVDLDFAAWAVEAFEKVKMAAENKVKRLTNGAVTSLGQTARILSFCAKQDVQLPNLQKSTVTEVLKLDLPEVVRAILDTRKKLSRAASISKYKAMLNRADLIDNRLRDHVRYFGAGPGRWVGQGVQTQNLVRKMDLAACEELMWLSKNSTRPGIIQYLREDPAKALSSSVRPTFCAAPGKELLCVDYSAIEARMLAWLTDDKNLSLFQEGKDIYIEMASKIYGRPITKDDENERLLGKQAELACGYQLWWKTLLLRCWQSGVEVSPSLAYRTVVSYRENHPNVRTFWGEIERAFIECFLYCKDTEVGCLNFVRAGDTVRMVFPSGRYIVYNGVSVRRVARSPGRQGALKETLQQLGAPEKAIQEAEELDAEETARTKTTYKLVPHYYREDSVTRKWSETTTYGGKLTENACQGIAGDILVEASLAVGAAPGVFGHAVMTVHDELVMEIEKGRGDLQLLIDTMCKVPSWARGLPLSGEGWIGERYRK